MTHKVLFVVLLCSIRICKSKLSSSYADDNEKRLQLIQKKYTVAKQLAKKTEAVPEQNEILEAADDAQRSGLSSLQRSLLNAREQNDMEAEAVVEGGTALHQKIAVKQQLVEDHIVAFLTHSVDELQLARVQDLNKEFPGQFRLFYDGTREAAMKNYPDLEPWQIVCSADPDMSLVGTMFLRTKQLGREKDYFARGNSTVQYFEKRVRSHEVLYSWLLLMAAGQNVKKVLAIENDVHYTDIAALKFIFDRFCESSVDLLYQEPDYLVLEETKKHEDSFWNFAVTADAVLPRAAVFKDSEIYEGMLNLYGLSRDFLTTLDRWRTLNEGRLAFHEPLFGSLAVEYGLTSECWQQWLGGNVAKNSGSMRWRPSWTWQDIKNFTQDATSEFLAAGLTPHGLIFHPVKATEVNRASGA